ncbi:SRPBCC family protein [Streptomyces sp. NPDC096934]|uniref:SRPBCC family protein n=1 Tax=Streptomyces sp. NPDC096934 TaxID=3155551 RepID=UPI003333C609
MIEVERSLILEHPLRDVVVYLADFAHTEDWDPGTISCRRIGRGDVALGTEWLNLSEFRGRRTELSYQLTRFDPIHLTFVGRNSKATSTDDMLFEDRVGRTRLTYRARIEFHGLARLAEPLLRRDFERLGDEVVRKLPVALRLYLSSGPKEA